MKNHWLKVHEQKKNFWTVEFTKNGIFILKPRRVGVINPRLSFGFMGATSGVTILNFKGGMVANNDKELIDFLIESRKSMKNWLSRIRQYAGMSKEIKYYELTGLHFDNIGMGIDIEDIKLSFHFDNLKQVHCG
jgi:hypothetical protein